MTSSVRDQVYIRDRVYPSVHDQVSDQVIERVWGQVADQVDDQVSAQVWERLHAWAFVQVRNRTQLRSSI